MKISPRHAIFGAALLTLAGCATEAQAPHNATVSQQDLDFVTTVYQLVQFDLDACEYVQKNTLEPKVEAAVNKICADAAKYAPRIRAQADSAGIKLPNALPVSLKAKLVSLTYHPEPNLSVEFLRDEISSHESALAVYNQEIRAGKNPEFVRVAKETKPLIEQNLKMLRSALPNGVEQ